MKLMSTFMYRRPVGLVSLLTVQPGSVAAAKTSTLAPYQAMCYTSTSQSADITLATSFLQFSCRQRKAKEYKGRTSALFSSRPEPRNNEIIRRRSYKKSVAEQESECRSSHMKSSNFSTRLLFTPSNSHEQRKNIF